MSNCKSISCDKYRRLFDKYASMPDDAPAFNTPEGMQWRDHGESCDKCIDWIRARTVRERGFSVDDFPCVHMAFYATFRCETHGDPWECPEDVIVYSPRIDEYGIPMRDGGKSVTGISHCPWCGVMLPVSKREAYLAALRKLGVDPALFNDEIPDAYQTDEWWRGRAVFPRWWPYVSRSE